LTSVALTLNVNVPDSVGVPERSPEEDRVSPFGKDPEATEYVGASPESSVATN
jgi:hypothetical protein